MRHLGGESTVRGCAGQRIDPELEIQKMLIAELSASQHVEASILDAAILLAVIQHRRVELVFIFQFPEDFLIGE